MLTRHFVCLCVCCVCTCVAAAGCPFPEDVLVGPSFSGGSSGKETTVIVSRGCVARGWSQGWGGWG